MAAVKVMRELRARLLFDWPVQVMDVAILNCGYKVLVSMVVIYSH